jgi:cytoskeletal protein CcmA (bactofilin family)
VARLAVSGTVRGVIHAKERIEVHAGGRLFAEIHAPALVVEEGAVIQGAVEAGGARQDPEHQ